MPAYREVRLLSIAEAAYLAGLIDSIGAGKLTNKSTSKAHHTPSYAYALWNRQALALLAQVEPYMRSYKRERARLVLKNYVRLTPRNGRYTDAMHAERRIFEDSVLGLRALGKREAPSACGGRGVMVEAAGQPIPSLSRRAGLCLHPAVAHATAGAGRVIRRSLSIFES
jgi:hypothetical protein